MPLPADILIALRYLRPKRTFISIITLLSILGPMLGVAILIIVTSVMSGFDHDIRKSILSMQAHLYVRPGEATIIEDPEPILKKLEELGAKASPVIDGPVLIQSRFGTSIKYVKGIDPKRERKVTNIADNGRFVGKFEIEEGEVLVGSILAQELGLTIGSELLIHAPQRLMGSVNWKENGEIKIDDPDELYLPEEVRVVGIFQMGVYEYDGSILFLNLDQADSLFGYDWGSATSVHASVPNPFQMAELMEAAQNAFPNQDVISWQQANQALFSTLRSEKILMVFLLLFIVLVASFGLAGTLITVAVQKTQEIGIMRAVGMSQFLVARIFILLGTIIGVSGTILGTTIGILVIHYREAVARLISRMMGHDVFPAKLYHLTQIPGKVLINDLVIIVSASVFICMMSSLIPALFASNLSPARALQEEN